MNHLCIHSGLIEEKKTRSTTKRKNPFGCNVRRILYTKHMLHASWQIIRISSFGQNGNRFDLIESYDRYALTMNRPIISARYTDTARKRQRQKRYKMLIRYNWMSSMREQCHKQTQSHRIGCWMGVYVAKSDFDMLLFWRAEDKSPERCWQLICVVSSGDFRAIFSFPRMNYSFSFNG